MTREEKKEEKNHMFDNYAGCHVIITSPQLEENKEREQNNIHRQEDHLYGKVVRIGNKVRKMCPI